MSRHGVDKNEKAACSGGPFPVLRISYSLMVIVVPPPP